MAWRRNSEETAQATGVLRRDGPTGQFRFDVTGELSQDLAKWQVGISDTCLRITLPDRNQERISAILSAASELGHKRGLATAGATPLTKQT